MDHDPCESAAAEASACSAAASAMEGAFPVSCAIIALARAHRQLSADLIAELGLHPGQELTLMLLWDQDGRSQKALCDAQRLDHSTVAKSLRRLEEAGLVRRCKSDDDARVQLVHLTEAGRALRERTRAAWSELENRTVAGLSPEELHAFLAVARRLAENADRAPD